MQIHQSKSSLAQPIGLALFVFLGSFVFSMAASSSFTPVSDSLASSEVNVEIEPSLSLTILDKDPNVSNNAVSMDTISMDVTPISSGSFITSTAYVVAGSNNETGYTLTFSDTDDDTDLANTSLASGESSAATTTTIPSITSTSSGLTDIELNKWGYAFNDDTVFSPIPTLSSPVQLASTTAEGAEVYPFTVAAKIDTAVPAGVYEDNLVFSLVANYVPPKVTEWEFDYTGGEQTFTVPADGIYKLEVWGAQGGYAYQRPGGYGAYSTGQIILKRNDKLYVNIGEKGSTSTGIGQVTNTTYNGGGASQTTCSQSHIDITNSSSGSGGGASHIALISGELKALEAYKGELSTTGQYYISDKIIIVASGGGGSAYSNTQNYAIGGHGGGLIGNNITDYTVHIMNYSGRKSNPGTQVAPACSSDPSTATNCSGFGYGGSTNDGLGRPFEGCLFPISGGGSGFFGGSGADYGGGAGGSGYIANPNLTNKYMTCYSCATSNVEATKTISNTNVSANPIADYAKQGNGYARITYLGRN